MLEFLFGIFLGIWVGQQVPLPSVHHYVLSRFQPPPPAVETKEDEQEDSIPLFTGDMPTTPAV